MPKRSWKNCVTHPIASGPSSLLAPTFLAFIMSLPNVWPAPSASSFIDLAPGSASTYPACGRSPGQDGVSRVLVLITLSACDRHFRYQVARTPVELSGHLASTTHRPRQPPARISALGDLNQAAVIAGIICSAVTQHRSDDPRQFVRQRDNDRVLVRSLQETFQPFPERCRARR